VELDLCGDPVMRRRVEKHWDAVFGLRRGLQRDAGGACRAYLAAVRERARGANAVRARLGLNRKALEDRAKGHVERAGWMRHYFTKATALHVADEVWQSADRFLFTDARGQRHGMPRVGSWWDFTRIPGRARSHTKAQPDRRPRRPGRPAHRNHRPHPAQPPARHRAGQSHPRPPAHPGNGPARGAGPVNHPPQPDDTLVRHW
jgi:hypothetical protein